LGIKDYFGILLVFIGQIITTFKGNVNRGGLKFAMIATVFLSLNNVLIKSGSDNFSNHFFWLR